MPLNALPAIDANARTGWTVQQEGLYHRLPYFVAKVQSDVKRTFPSWSSYTKKRKWKANMGDKMTGVRTNASPHLRQFAFPTLMSQTPKKDVVDLRETEVHANIYRHRFESPIFHFYPSFTDFMSHVMDHSKDISEKIERFNDIYIRSNVFHMAPYAFVCKANGTVDLVKTTPWSGLGNFDEDNDGKNTAVRVDLINKATGNLTLTALNHAATIIENDLRVPFFKGSDLPKEDAPLNGMFKLLTSSEAYNQFTFDPYLKENKNCQLDVVKDRYRGNIFGMITTQLEDMPLRFQQDGTYATPEVRVADDSEALDDGESQPNPEYADPAESPTEVAFIGGPSGYESIDVGPPPSEFTGDEMPHNFPGMFWNAEVKLTKNILVEYIDADTGEYKYETNVYGEFLKFISQGTFGILPVQRRNIIPIFFKRKRGVVI